MAEKKSVRYMGTVKEMIKEKKSLEEGVRVLLNHFSDRWGIGIDEVSIKRTITLADQHSDGCGCVISVDVRLNL